MNDFQIYTKKYSKLSLYKNDLQKAKMKHLPQGLKNIIITNSNGLDISSQYGNYQNSKKNMLEDNFNYKHITYNNSNNKNLSFPINTTSCNKNINPKYKEGSLIHRKNNLFKKKFEKCINNSKKDDSSNYYNSKENTNNNINIINNMNDIMFKKNNLKINIIPKKANFKLMSLKDNISLNSNQNFGKSISKSKSKSKSKNKKENKSFNNKVNNNNINKIIFDKYLKLYKIGEKGFNKKNIRSNKNIFNKESPNYILNKYSNERNNSDKNKMSSLNMANNIQIKGLKKKNKSSNLLISNLNKPKNMYTSNQSSNVIISRFESNNNTNIKIKNSKTNNKIDNANNNLNNKNSKKYLTENHIMYLINKKASLKKRKNKNNKDKQMSLKNIKNDSNNNINTNTNNTNNNNSNSNYYLNNYFNEKKQNNENQENVIYDYSCNNILFNKFHNNDNFKNSKKNFRHNYDNENSENIYKMLNERLKTEYNDNSLEAIDKMYEEENTEELNQKSVSLSKRDGIRFLYPEIYNRDDEYYIENENNDKREKELDETESPLKMDTEKDNIENSGVLSFDQVKDIICYYNMNNPDKQNNFLFQKNERQIYDINYKNKYLNYFFGNSNNNNDKKNNDNNNNNDLFDDGIMFNHNTNYKYPNNSIFSY